jgi:hypothetical protein
VGIDGSNVCAVLPCSLLHNDGGCEGGLKVDDEDGAAGLVCIVGNTELEGKGAARDIGSKLW